MASSRAVALSETFERPLIIGYLGFDFPILPDGSLGSPVATLERVRDREQPEVRLGEFNEAQKQEILLGLVLAGLAADKQALIYDAAATLLGSDFLKAYQQERRLQPGDEAAGRAFSKARKSAIREDAEAEQQIFRALFQAWEQHGH
jgi:hypothetical protein